MDRIIIGLTGSLASGKDTVVTHLKGLGFISESLSDRLREEMKLRGEDSFRTSLQDLGNELRRLHGGQVLAERTLPLIIDKEENLVINSIRNPEEINYLRDALNVLIIGVDAPVDLRRVWYVERAKERGEDSTAVEDFEKHNNRDYGIGEPDNGQQVKKCLEMADIVISNDRSKAELNKEVDLLLQEIFHFDPEIHSPNPEKR